MKTILSRMKQLVRNKMVAGQTLEYVKFAEVVHPEVYQINDVSLSVLPSVFFAPGLTSEAWEATLKKVATHRVYAYLTMRYAQRELNVIGDETRGLNGKGMLDFENDFLSVFRGHRLSVEGVEYLDKPLDVEEIDRNPVEVQENVFVLVSRITFLATRLFNQIELPGNI